MFVLELVAAWKHGDSYIRLKILWDSELRIEQEDKPYLDLLSSDGPPQVVQALYSTVHLNQVC